MVHNSEGKILVVDDNASKRYVTVRMLRAAGFETSEAINGHQALEMAGDADAVVLDVNLPDIDGYEVCRRLRARETTSHLPVIHLSATFVEDSDRVHGLNVGADGYLTHPIEPQVLVATVRAFVRARAANQQVALMLSELDHRVKNTLATVQAIAMQTISTSSTLEEFKDAFIPRLLALSNTHNLLASDAWSGVHLRDVFSSELAPYDNGIAGRYTLSGDDLKLSPKMALGLAMVTHELSTNAAKYGALSVPDGRVDVDWAYFDHEQKGRSLRIRWSESGGPPVSIPSRRGFGTRLITHGTAFELHGSAVTDYAPSGVSCVIEIPLTRTTA
jgi:two-component sensor histidine kinase